jgi:O-antigen/teichoic acid export membrane protein
VNVATLLISIPLVLNYLGPERYGLWLMMSSFVYILSFADLGVGNALIAFVADAHGKADRCEIRAAVSTAALIFLALSATILLVVLTINSVMPWSAWFNVLSEPAISEIGHGFVVFVGCLALSIPLNLTACLQSGLQEGFRANAWATFGSLLGLTTVLIAIHYKASLPWLALASAGSPLFASLINGLFFFTNRGRDLAPSLRFVSLSFGRRLIAAGSAFLGLQVMVAVNVASDNLIIGRMSGPQAVTAFAVPERIFGLIPMLLHLALQPLWPAYSEARVRGDVDWIRKILRRSLLTTLAVSVASSVLLLILGRGIIQIWTSDAVRPSLYLLAGLGLWKVVDSVEFAVTILLSSARMLKPQLVFGFTAMSAAIAGKLLFIPVLGPDVVPWVSGVARLLFVLIPLYLISRSITKPRFADPC